VAGLAEEADSGHPLTLTGEGGLYKQRERLPEGFRDMPKHKLEAFGPKLIDEGRIVQCSAAGSHHGKWLDVPGGKFALGIGSSVILRSTGFLCAAQLPMGTGPFWEPKP